ncbi:MAG: ABC transporter permease [Acidobacteriia bacterium]|nr:ABC transporter permease [Terriglobia bacterium]
MLRKSPLFALAAAVTIGLGIGASTAIFSVTHAVVLRPLPYKASERLVLVEPLLSNACYIDLRNGTKTAFEEMSAIMLYRAVVPREDGSAERISKAQVTTNFFRMLGGTIAFGRDFTEADGQPQAQPEPIFPPPQGAVAILSYEYWQRRYGANPAAMGLHMLGSGHPRPQMVGVLAPGFRLFLPGLFAAEPSPDVWIANNRGYDEAHRDIGMLRVIGRLRAGVTLERAQAQVDRVGADWRVPDLHVRLAPWHQTLVAEVRPAILALMGAVIFLLLIACANVANLLLVRMSVRERELAVRAALGAGRGRLTRQMLAEAMLLSGLGTLLGVGFAWLGLRELLLIVPENVPRLETVAIDWPVLAFAALAGLAEAAVFGVLPGWRAAGPGMMQVLRTGGRNAGLSAGSLLRHTVVIAEVALSFILLVGSGLMLRSFLELRRVDPGYEPHGLLTFLAVGDARGFDEPERRLAFLRELKDRLRAIPGVQSVGGSAFFPLKNRGPFTGAPWGTEETFADPARRQTAEVGYVLPGYFETLRTRLLAGRTFTEGDNAPGRNVAVVDQFLASKAFPNQSAIGKRIVIPYIDPPWLEVIGVVAHQRQASLAEPGLAQIYLTDGFYGIGISRNWALRVAGDPVQYAPAARAAISGLAPGRLAITEMQTMDAIVNRAGAETRFQLLLIGIFAAVAALLAAVGLYGVLSSAVRQRTAEIGVRMALGAAPAGIFKLVIVQGLLLTAAGIGLGLAAAFGLTRAMRSMLVGVSATDPATFAVMTALFFLIAAVASWVPARRAAGLDPAAALREE